MATLPDLPIRTEDSNYYKVRVEDLEIWARAVLVLKYNELSEELGETYLMVRTWLSAYESKFPETTFDHAPLYLDVLVWLDGFVAYLEGLS